MRFRSRRTLVTAAITAAAITVVAGGATALAESGSGSAGAAPQASMTDIALLGPVTVAVPVGSVEDCGPLPGDPGGGPLAGVAEYLGLSAAELKNELGSGKSLAEIATAHGKSVDGLKQAVLDAAKKDLDREVAEGDLTAEQEQTILSQLRNGLDDFVNGKDGLRIKIEAKGAGPDLALGGPFETAADYLGLSVDQLTDELRAGKSLAEIASAHGKSVSGLKQKLIDAATADIEKAVTKLMNQKGLPEPSCVEKVSAFAAPDTP
jgi:DNA-binding CsgD family transcriptional regulator